MHAKCSAARHDAGRVQNAAAPERTGALQTGLELLHDLVVDGPAAQLLDDVFFLCTVIETI